MAEENGDLNKDFENGDLNNDFENGKQTEEMSVRPSNFIVFLILILLLMGNRNTFSSYFQLLETQVNKVSELFKALEVTANGLQSAFEDPQKIMNNIEW